MALTIEYGVRGSNSTHIGVTVTSGAAVTIFTNAQLVLGLPTTNSLLYTFLTTAFPTPADAEAAFRAIGGRIVVRQNGGTPSTTELKVTWVCAASVPGVAVQAGTADITFEMEISADHSIVQ